MEIKFTLKHLDALLERAEWAETRVKELEFAADKRARELLEMSARVALLRVALANLIDEPAMPLSRIQARDILFSLNPAADRLLRERELLRVIANTADRNDSCQCLEHRSALQAALTALREFDKEKT